MGEVTKLRLVQELVPHPAVKAFYKAILHRLARRDVTPLDLLLGAHFRIAFEVRSVLLSLTIIPSLSRRSISAVISRATRQPSIEGEPSCRHRFEADRDRIGGNAFPRGVINYVQHAEASPAGELVMPIRRESSPRNFF